MQMKTPYKGRQNRKTKGTLDLDVLPLDCCLLDETANLKKMATGLGFVPLQIPLNLVYMGIKLKKWTKETFFKLKCFY